MSVAKPKLLLRVPEAAQTLSISRSQAYELIRRGIIPSIRLGGSVRVPQADLEELIRRIAESASEQALWRN